MDEELRFHVEMETERNLRRGLGKTEARRQALVKLGGLEQIRESVRDERGTRPFEDVIRDLGYAVRISRRHPTFTLAAVLSLGVAIGFNTVVFTVVDSFLFRPLPVERPKELVDIYTGAPGDPYSTSSYPDYLDVRARNQVFDDVVGHSPALAAVRIGDDSQVVLGESVTGNYFQMLGISPDQGRLLRPTDDQPGAPRVVVLSTGLRQRAFGGVDDVVGRMILVQGHQYEVVGVAPAAFTGMPPMPGPDMWTAMVWNEAVEPIIRQVVPSLGESRLTRRGERWLFMKGRLREGVTLARAQADTGLIMADIEAQFPESNDDRRVTLTLTDQFRVFPNVAGPVTAVATGLAVMVAMVLLVACANVTSMLLARCVGRRREIGVRLAIGAGRRRLMQQLLTESLLLAGFGAALGLSLTWLLFRTLATADLPLPVPIPLEFSLDSRVLLYTVALGLGVGVLAGLVPALRATRPNLVAELSGTVPGPRLGRVRWSLRDALVAAQLAVTIPLLVMAGLFAQSSNRAETVALGFDADRVATVSTSLTTIGYDDDEARQFLELSLERMAAMPGVQRVAIASRVPLSLSFSDLPLLVDGQHGPEARGSSTSTSTVSEGYFETIGVPLLEGRSFTTVDTPASPRVAIVTRAMAERFWPGQSAVGQAFRVREWDAPAAEVVGVVADHKIRFPTESDTPMVHFAASQFPPTAGVLMARTRGDAGALATRLRRDLLGLEPNLVFLDGDTLRDSADVMLLPFEIAASGAGSLGFVAMLLAATGLYGIIACVVTQRTRELAIRAALGARRLEQIRLVLAAGARVIVLGTVVGVGLALALAQSAMRFLFRVAPLDPWVWVGTLALLGLVGCAAYTVPTWRAIRLNPVQALRVD